MAYLSLVYFADRYITLAYGLPLLFCLWRQEKWLLWTMAFAMAAIATAKALLIVPGLPPEDIIQWVMHLLNLFAIGLSVHFVINVTHRLNNKNAELAEANQELRVVVQFHEENPNPVLRVEREGTVVYANDAAEKLLDVEGYKRGDVAPPLLLEPAKSALHSSKSFAIDIPFGGKKYVQFSFIPVASADYVNIYGRDVTTEREAEAALRQSEELFRGTFENAGVGVSHVDRSRRFLRVNRYLADMLGYTPEELSGGDFADLTWPEDREADSVFFTRLINADLDHYSLQKRYTRRGGLPVWSLVTRSAQRDEHGNFLYAITIVQDISELHALTEKLQRYQLLANNTRDIVLFIRLEGWKILEANVAAEQAYGYSREELLSLTIQDLRAPSSHPLTSEQLDDAYNRGLLFEVMHRRKDGSTFPAEISSRGALVGGMPTLVSVVRDISERKRAEEALQRSEENARARADELDAIMDALPVPTLIAHDAQGLHITGNQAAYQILHVPLGSNLSWHSGGAPGNIKVMSGGIELSADEWPVQKVLLKGQEVRGQELEFVYEDGTVSYLVGNIAPLRDAQGKVRGAVAAFVDIGNRKTYEAQLKNLADDLTRSNKDLERFAYVASHDLQEPLRQIVAFADIIERRYSDKLDQAGKEFIEFIVGGGKRMQNLIQDLLAFSRVGRKEGTRQPTPLDKTVRRVLSSLSLRVRESDALITVDPLPTLVVEATQIEQVFQNLIGNAIKFRGAERPEIHVGARQEGAHWLFWVRDNGIGFNMNEAQELFQMFHRMHGRDKYPGTGMGLAICKRIVELHGGRIWAESKPGEGSTFYFTLPKSAQ